MRSLKDYGAARSIAIDERGVVLAGNGVLDGATEAGITKVRIVESNGDEIIAVRRRNLTARQKRELAIADNRTSELAEWSADTLEGAGRGVLGKFWTEDELARLFGGGVAKGHTEPDALPPVPKRTSIKRGDRISLGRHTLVCGDAANGGDVARLVDGARLDLVVTSPPYNVGIKYQSHKDSSARDVYLAFIEATARAFVEHLEPGRFVAWNIGVSPKTFPAHQVVRLEATGLQFYRQIVWAKSGVPYPVFPSTLRTKRARHYHPNYTHEVIELLETPAADPKVPQVMCALCDGTGKMAARELPAASGHETVQLMAWGEPALGAPIAPDLRYRNDVWSVHQSQASVDLKTVSTRSTGLERSGKRTHMVKEHPAAFPVELPRALIGFLTGPGEIVYDPFGGSGSTLVACEQTERRAMLMEIDPIYCQLIVDRWQAFTGKKAQKLASPKPRGRRR